MLIIVDWLNFSDFGLLSFGLGAFKASIERGRLLGAFDISTEIELFLDRSLSFRLTLLLIIFDGKDLLDLWTLLGLRAFDVHVELGLLPLAFDVNIHGELLLSSPFSLSLWLLFIVIYGLNLSHIWLVLDWLHLSFLWLRSTSLGFINVHAERGLLPLAFNIDVDVELGSFSLRLALLLIILNRQDFLDYWLLLLCLRGFNVHVELGLPPLGFDVDVHGELRLCSLGVTSLLLGFRWNWDHRDVLLLLVVRFGTCVLA